MPGGFLFGIAPVRLQRHERPGAVHRQRVVRSRLGRGAAVGHRARRELFAPAVRIGAVSRRRHVGQFQRLVRAAEPGVLPLRRQSPAPGRQRGARVPARPTQHSVAFRLNHNRFEDTEGRQQTELDLTRGTLTNQTPTSGQFSQGRATREYRDYNQQHLINAAMVVGTHELPRSTVDWNIGASRGQRETPFRVDWEFRSAANAFPNRYDVSDPELVRVTPAENFLLRARHIRSGACATARTSNVRTCSPASSTSSARRRSAAHPGYWKAGAKVVTRDKLQDRTNDNYNAGAQPFTLADFGLGGTGPDDFFQGEFPLRPDAQSLGPAGVLRAEPVALRRSMP